MSDWEPRATAQPGGVKGAWRKFRGLPLWVQVVAWIVIGLLGAAAGSSEDEPEQVATQAPTSVQEAQEEPVRTEAPTTTVRVTTSATQAGPKTTFGNGTWRVGVDIAPGTYVAPGGSGCYWERQSAFGSPDAIIDNDFAAGGGQVVVTIAATDKGFKTSGCGTWRQG